jgi:hypothetical protein
LKYGFGAVEFLATAHQIVDIVEAVRATDLEVEGRENRGQSAALGGVGA